MDRNKVRWIGVAGCCHTAQEEDQLPLRGGRGGAQEKIGEFVSSCKKGNGAKETNKKRWQDRVTCRQEVQTKGKGKQRGNRQKWLTKTLKTNPQKTEKLNQGETSF